MSAEKSPVNLVELADIIADNARSSAMSALYYRKVVAKIRKKGRIVDTIVALSSASSAGGLVVAQEAWKVNLQPLWIALGAVASIIALLRPIWFKFDDQIDKAASFHRLWQDIQEDYLDLSEKLRVLGPIQKLVDQAMTLSTRFWKAQKQDDEDPNDVFLRECQERIKVMFPRSEFWGVAPDEPQGELPGSAVEKQLPTGQASPEKRATKESVRPPKDMKSEVEAKATEIEAHAEVEAAQALDESKRVKK